MRKPRTEADMRWFVAASYCRRNGDLTALLPLLLPLLSPLLSPYARGVVKELLADARLKRPRGAPKRALLDPANIARADRVMRVRDRRDNDGLSTAEAIEFVAKESGADVETLARDVRGDTKAVNRILAGEAPDCVWDSFR